MTITEQEKAATEFVAKWTGRGDEKSETHNFWIELLRSVYGVKSPENIIEFEKRVQLDHTSFIDGYITTTQILIEQKSIDIDLKKGYKQSDGSLLTPFQQAHRYAAKLPRSEFPKWIIVCNFKTFLVYDMEKPNSEPQEIALKDLAKDYYRLSFIVDTGDVHLQKEMDLSIQSGLVLRRRTFMSDTEVEKMENKSDSGRSFGVIAIIIKNRAQCASQVNQILTEAKVANSTFLLYIFSYD